MSGARQAISRLRARGPRRLVPPGEVPDTAGEGSGEDGFVPAAGALARAEGPGRGVPADASAPSAGTDAAVAQRDGADAPGAGRPKGLTRRGHVRRRMWLDRGPGYRIWAGGPVPPGAAAWTLGRWVIVRRRHAHNSRLLAHEEEHVRQWVERGRVGFLAWYLRGYLTWRLRGHPHAAAYRRIPAEVQADWRSRRRLGIGVGHDPSTTPPAR